MPWLTYTGCVLGAGKSGMTGSIGYRLVNADGSQARAFTTTGVAELGLAGSYHVAGGISLPDGFRGLIEWGTAGQVLAVAFVNPEEAEYTDAKTTSRLAAEDYTAPSPVDPTDIVNGVATRLATDHGEGSWEGGGGTTSGHQALVTVRDSNGAVVVGVVVAIKSSDLSSIIAWGQTNSSGQVEATLRAGVYKVCITSGPGHAAFPPAPLTVGGPVTPTYTLTVQAATPPPMPGLCAVSGYVFHPDGSPMVGVKVNARLIQKNNLLSAGVVDDSVCAATTLNNGYFELRLVQKSQFLRGDGQYVITVAGTSFSTVITVPDQDTITLPTLVTES